jgi:glutathione-regulated potassium-efflux system ancillary protein KefC
MDYLWVAIAFICGLLAKQTSLPPLVGYLAAGFGLHALGVVPDTTIDTLAELGITLLLFTIGLKLNFKNLLKPEIWAGASVHMFVIVMLTILNCLIFSSLGIAHFVGLDWQAAAMIGFAVSFSSTVFVVKVLESKGELKSRHGQIAIGILVIQDIVAIIFVSVATDKTPSYWVFLLLALPLVKPLLSKILDLCEHGELLPLAGFFLALGGAELFELIGLKGYLGALVIAILVSGHDKASELSRSLLGFKDVFLIGFFLSIGFTAIPTVDMLAVAFIMAIALPVKAGLFFIWLTRLKLRSRTAFLAAMSLSNYSEFGLIVCSAGVAHALLDKEWLVIMALAVAMSFIFASILDSQAHRLYAMWSTKLRLFETDVCLEEDQYSQPDDNSTILVVGMGRVGRGAYDTLASKLHENVCGVEVDPIRSKKLKETARHVICGDAEDPEFWSQVKHEKIRLIMLAIPNYLDTLEVVNQLQHAGYQGKTAATAKYEDEKKKLLDAGINVVFNLYAEAGVGFAEESVHLLKTLDAKITYIKEI